MSLGSFPVAVRLVVAALVALVLLGVAIKVLRSRRRVDPPIERTLPEGAEAALWSVVEVMGDPRNHLVGKDPTSELRITDIRAASGVAEARRLAEDDLQARAFGDTPAPRPAELARVERARAARQLAEAKRAARIEAGGTPLPKRPVPAHRTIGNPVRPASYPTRAAS